MMKRIAAGFLLSLLSAASLAQAQRAESWRYEYADLQYGRHREAFVVTPGDASNGDGGRYALRQMGAGKMLPEYFARALAGGTPPAQWPLPSDYPTYATPYLEWTYAVKVIGWEEISVPAGRFRALKVEVEGNRGKDPDPFWWPKQAMRFVHTIWYAPEAGRYVKARHQAWAMTGNLFADDGVELVERRAD